MDVDKSETSVAGYRDLISEYEMEPFHGRHAHRSMPSDIQNMLGKVYLQIVFDGFTADVEDENPYGRGVNKSYVERASHILWNRGRAFREAGRSLRAACQVDERK